MGKKDKLKQEIHMRIHRYLNRAVGPEAPPEIAFTVEGKRLESDLAHFCETAEEEVFEEYIAGLYDNNRYHRRIRFLGKRWKLLDWLLGPFEERIYRTQFRRYDDTTEQYRRSYRNYLKKDYLYVDRHGNHRTITESYYNRRRLEQLLPDEQFDTLMLLKYGPDKPPVEHWEQIEYDQPPALDGIDAPPPYVADWLLRALRGSTFQRSEIG